MFSVLLINNTNQKIKLLSKCQPCYVRSTSWSLSGSALARKMVLIRKKTVTVLDQITQFSRLSMILVRQGVHGVQARSHPNLGISHKDPTRVVSSLPNHSRTTKPTSDIISLKVFFGEKNPQGAP